MRIAILPARGGSKRIPRKNIIDFCGLPMIAHVINELQKSQAFDTIHVSTDDTEIATIANNLGVDVPFLREKTLADDHTPVFEVVKWVMNEYQKIGKRFDTVALVMPCSPLLESKDFNTAIEKFEKSSKLVPLLAVCEYPSPIEWAFREIGEGVIRADSKELLKLSQDLPKSYYDSGLLAIFDYKKQIACATIKVGNQFLKYLLPRWKAVDIDTWDDIEFAQKMMVFKNA